MKSISAIAACAFLAFSAPAFAQNNSNDTSRSLQQNGSPNGPGASHAKESAAPNTEAGPAAGGTEGRSSATDMTTNNGSSGNPGPGTSQQRDVK